MRLLPDSALNALRHLARYRFLTISRLLWLGGTRKTRRSMANLLRQLMEDHGLINVAHYGVHPQKGRLESVYFLTPAGARLVRTLSQGESSPKFPGTSTTIFQRDYFHRLVCLDFEIAFGLHLKMSRSQLLAFDRYFDFHQDKEGRYQPSTRLTLPNGQIVVPDGWCRYQTADKSWAFLMEATIGSHVPKVLAQLKHHALILEEGLPSKLHKLSHGHFVVCLFNKPACMRAVMTSLAEDRSLAPLQQRYLFAQLPETGQAFTDIRWQFWNSEICNFYGL